jgi:MFS family permease
MGLGVGPLFAGPISELYGRNIVYRMSFVLFFIFSFPVAFAREIGTSKRGISPFLGCNMFD